MKFWIGMTSSVVIGFLLVSTFLNLNKSNLPQSEEKKEICHAHSPKITLGAFTTEEISKLKGVRIGEIIFNRDTGELLMTTSPLSGTWIKLEDYPLRSIKK